MIKGINTLTAERDRALRAWSDMNWRVKQAQNYGVNVDMLPIMEGQARFLWAEYESLAAKVDRRRMFHIVKEGAR